MGVHWSRILGVVLYTDGVRYTTRDSFIGFFVTDYRTMDMHLCALFRKGDACKCGCRGWCALYPNLLELALDLRDSEVVGFLIACLMTKGDWPAYCEIAGVRQWYSWNWGNQFILCACHLIRPPIQRASQGPHDLPQQQIIKK